MKKVFLIIAFICLGTGLATAQSELPQGASLHALFRVAPRTITDDGINIVIQAGPNSPGGKVTVLGGPSNGPGRGGDVIHEGGIGGPGTDVTSGFVINRGANGFGFGQPDNIGGQAGGVQNLGGHATGNALTGPAGNSGGSISNIAGNSFNHEGGGVINKGGDAGGLAPSTGGQVRNFGGNCLVQDCNGGPVSSFAGHSLAPGSGGFGGNLIGMAGNSSGDGTVSRPGGFWSFIGGDGVGPGGDGSFSGGRGTLGGKGGDLNFFGGIPLAPGGSATGGSVNYRAADGFNGGTGSPGGKIEGKAGKGFGLSSNPGGDVRWIAGDSEGGAAGNYVSIAGNGRFGGVNRMIAGTGDIANGSLIFDIGATNKLNITTTLASFSVPVQSSSQFNVAGVKVVGTQCPAIPNAVDATDAVVKLNQLLGCLRAHGLVAQ